MSTIEEAREQARAAQEQISNRLIGSRLGLSSTREMDKDMLALSNGLDAIRALLDATEPSTVAVKTEFRVLDAPKDCDYHEGFEEGIKVGRAGSGPRPITDEMVAAADFAIMPYWGERYPSGSLTTEIARAALEAAEGARR